MANTINGFLQRITAASGEYNAAKVGTLGALDAVWPDLRGEPATMGQMIRIYFPDLLPFTDQANNDWNPEAINPAYLDVPFLERPGKAILITDFEQFQTSTDIIKQFVDPNYKRALEYANGAIFSLLTPTNFPLTAVPPQASGYPAITTLPAEVDIPSAKLAWNLLVRNKVPLQEENNATILYHPDVHANTLTDAAWNQESLVSAVIALGTRQQAADPGTAANQAFKFTRRYDQQAPTGTAALAGTVTTVNGSVAIVGVGTTFTGFPVGTWLKFGTDTIEYPVAKITDDTHLNLGEAYQGTGAGGVAATRKTYVGIAMHRYCIALAVRPLALVNNEAVQSRLVVLNGIPMRLQLSYQHLKNGWMMTLDYGMVARVIRPDFGVLLNS